MAQFIVIMDTRHQTDFGYSQSGLHWIFNAYVIVFGGFLLLGGRMSDLFGARKVFMWGFAILTNASLLACVVWSEPILNKN